MKLSPVQRGLLVAVIHLAIVASLGAKLLVDRATLPRVWARTAPYDPNLPIRGRYVSLRVGAVVAQPSTLDVRPPLFVALSAQNGELVATPVSGSGLGATVAPQGPVGSYGVWLQQPVAYFIPEHAADPSVRPPGEELWVEVTVPRAGPPRPIRLGVKRNGILTPLEVN